MSHARLAPSKAKLWMVCPASVRRQEALPDDIPSDASIWGTVCHAILERSLLNMVHPQDVNVTGIPDIGLFGIWDLQEMRDVAAVAYDYVQFEGEIYAESKANPGAVIGRLDCWGTADITILTPTSIEVVDLKTGKGVFCEADDPQLKLYAVGKLWEHYPGLFTRGTADDAPGPGPAVKLTIVQPRFSGAEPIRSVVFSAEELIGWAHRDFYAAALATDRDDAPAVPGDHCDKGFCKARGTCPELAQKGLAAAQAVFKDANLVPEGPEDRGALAAALVRDPDQLTLEQVRYILDHEKLITGWLAKVREYAAERIKAGHRVPGYKLVNGRGTRNWTVEPELLFLELGGVVKQDGRPIGREDLFVESPISPAQAEKQLKPLLSAEAWSAVAAYITKSPGAPTLAPETDSRPALLTNAADVFKPVEADLDFLN